MSYSLKSDIDLSGARKTGAWLTQPRIKHGEGGGRWTKGGGGWRPDPSYVPAGKHARFKDPERDTADSYQGVSVKTQEEWSKVDFDGLFEQAASAPTQTERERAAREVTLHLEQMKRKIETETAHSRSVRTESHTISTVTSKPVVKPVVKTGKYVEESLSDATRVTLAAKVMEVAVRAVGASAVLLGAEESEHMAEMMEHLSHNVAVHSGVTVALTLLITYLIARIQKTMRERHDRRIAKARGELP